MAGVPGVPKRRNTFPPADLICYAFLADSRSFRAVSVSTEGSPLGDRTMYLLGHITEVEVSR
jgi:hypothetical protein